jgi:hypothetical protein
MDAPFVTDQALDAESLHGSNLVGGHEQSSERDDPAAGRALGPTLTAVKGYGQAPTPRVLVTGSSDPKVP